MKCRNLFLILCISLSYQCSGNVIDKIKTKQDVIRFLNKHLRIGYEYRELFKEHNLAPSPYAEHYGSDSFYVIDIDKNGLSDLIVDGKDFIVFLDSGNNRYETIYLYGSNFAMRGIKNTDAASYLLLRVEKLVGDGTNDAYDTTVIYKDHAFIEFVSYPSQYTIEKIEYNYTPGFCRECHSFSIVIDSNKAARISSEHLSLAKNKTKDTLVTLSVVEYQKIVNLLNYMNFEKLASDYSQPATDLSYGQLSVHYHGGKIKEIRDYGSAGTLALSYLYSVLSEYYFAKTGAKENRE